MRELRVFETSALRRRALATGFVAAMLVVASPAAWSADVAQSYRRHNKAVVRAPAVVAVVPPSEYYERPLYEGPAFFYQPYYGKGPALQWFDFSLGRDKTGYQ